MHGKKYVFIRENGVLSSPLRGSLIADEVTDYISRVTGFWSIFRRLTANRILVRCAPLFMYEIKIAIFQVRRKTRSQQISVYNFHFASYIYTLSDHPYTSERMIDLQQKRRKFKLFLKRVYYRAYTSSHACLYLILEDFRNDN